MNRRYGPSLLLLSFLVLFLQPYACWSAPQAAADAAYAKKIEAMLPPKVECMASSPIVVSGQSVILTAQVQGVSAGLVYSFSSNGGKLYADGPMARLDTTGVPAGRNISATCQVANGLGRRGSGNVIVRVVAYGLPQTTASPTTITRAGGNNGRNVIEHDMQTAQAGQSHTAPSSSSRQAEAEEIPRPVPPPPVVASMAAAPAHAPAPAAAAPHPPAAHATDPYQESEVRAQWVKALKNGKIEYVIPKQMELHETSVVTVVIHGFADTSQNNLAGAQAGTLKVSPYMRMELTAANPDEFKIDPKAGAVLPVPIDSSAQWTWNVVPQQPAKDQTLMIEAFLVYSENGDNPQELLPSYSATVSVSVPGFWESVREDFWNDPSAAIKYVLPGGAGFTALAGLTVWWWKRRHPEENKAEKDEK